MNQYSYRNLNLGFADLSRLLLPLMVIWLLGALGLGWLVKSFFILIGLLLITPVLAFVGLRWWLKRHVIQAHCPVCSTEFVSLDQAEFRCPSCSEPLRVENKQFVRLTPPGTIDVSAIEVPAQSIED